MDFILQKRCLKWKVLARMMQKQKGLKSRIDNKVYETVPYNNQQCLSLRWVC